MSTSPLIYHSRVHVGEHFRETLLTLIKKHTDSYLIAHEAVKGRRPHFHLILQDIDKKQLNADYTNIGIPASNKGRSFSKLRKTLPELISYCVKEDPKYVIGPGWDQEDVSKGLELAQGYEKVKGKSILLQLSAKLESQMTLGEHELNGTRAYLLTETQMRPNAGWVYDQVIDFYYKSDRLIREYQIISLVQTLLLKYNANYRYQYRSNILKKIEPDNREWW